MSILYIKMVSIINKSELQKMSNARLITEKISKKEITSRVNETFKPQKQKSIVIKGGGGRRPRVRSPTRSAPPRVDDRLIEFLEHRRRTSRYNEYKTSLREGLTGIMAMIERNPHYKEGLKQKIGSSHDINDILTNKLEAFNFIENDNIILGLTVVAKYLENRSSTREPTPPPPPPPPPPSKEKEELKDA